MVAFSRQAFSRQAAADPLQRALAFHQSGDLARAEDAYRRLLAIDPRNVHALHLIAHLSIQTGRCDAGLEWADRALQFKPDFADAHNARGAALRGLGRLEEALAAFDRALAVKPRFAEAALNRGLVLNALRRPAEALPALDRALTLLPGHVEALCGRGDALRALQRPEDALASYRQALAKDPARAKVWEVCGDILHQLHRYDEALVAIDRVLALSPDDPGLLDARGNALQALGRFEESLVAYDRALALNPRSVVTLHNVGNALSQLKRLDEARLAYDVALAIAPGHAASRTRRSFLLLLQGEFEAGWAGYESRHYAEDRLPLAVDDPAPFWRGEAVNGKSVLVYEEQGFGDTLQFCRYLPLLAARGAAVTFAARPPMAALMRLSFPGLRVLAQPPEGESFDFQCPLMSLPHAFRTTLATIPNPAPYLAVDPARVTSWRDRLGAGGFKIGVVWRGSAHSRRVGRSFPIGQLAPLAAIPNVRLISLQKAEGVEGFDELPPDMQVETLGDEFDAGPDAFLDAGAVMRNMDLIVSADTSLAHLAGALARPVWVAVPDPAEWRWLIGRSDSPWYPTLRLFRQPARGDWAGVMAEMAAALRERLK